MANSILWETTGHSKHKKIFKIAKFTKRTTKVATLTVYTMQNGIHCKLTNTTLIVLVYVYHGERDAQTYAVACTVENALSADFWWSDHFHLLLWGAVCLVTTVGSVSGYCILRHKLSVCGRGGNRPERSKFVSELPHFTIRIGTCTCSHYQALLLYKGRGLRMRLALGIVIEVDKFNRKHHHCLAALMIS